MRLVLLCVSLMCPTLTFPETQVVMLGTGTPIPTPERAGPATAIVVDGKAYLVDFGPGVVRRAAAVSAEYGGPLEAMNVERLDIAFLTHLHHDHTAGLPDLARWRARRLSERRQPRPRHSGHQPCAGGLR